MAVQSINQIQCKLLGLSLMKEEENQQIKKHWDSRFQNSEAFWVELAPNQTVGTIIKDICTEMEKQGIHSMAGQKLLMAVFLDLREAVEEKVLHELLTLPQELSQALGCNMSLNFEFGALGKIAFGDKKQMRTNAGKVIEINTAHADDCRMQLCLTASPTLGGVEEDFCWKSVTVLLDVLRRKTAPEFDVPVGGKSVPNDDVGMLRYGEYEEEVLNRLRVRLDELNRALSNQGAEELKQAVNAYLRRAEEEIESLYPVSGSLMPQPTALRVKGFFAERQAAAGRNRDFNAAKIALINAVGETSAKMKEDILTHYRGDFDRAGDILEALLREAGVGIQLEQDHDAMNKLLSLAENESMAVPELVISYKGDNTENIKAHLLGARRKTIVTVKERLLAALRTANEAKTETFFRTKQAQLQNEQAEINNKIRGLLTAKELTSQFMSGNPLPKTCFNPIISGGDTFSAILCREDKGQTLLSGCGCQNAFRIDKDHGGLKTVDGVPLKAIQLLFFNGDEARLCDLIK